MPKDKRERSVSNESCRGSPFSCSSSRLRSRPSPKNIKESEENVKEWEDARCPVCMEHPHNAVLLLCSSHDKGCRPFMCDTSYRHSNCLDQFRKSISDASNLVSQQMEAVDAAAEPTADLIETLTPNAEVTPGYMTGDIGVGSSGIHIIPCDNPTKPTLVCPLCRGKISGWIVVEPARHFMNAKHRSCACETCEFSGTYSDLRKHARISHPLVRPCEADPERQRSWRRLERQRDLGDLISTLQSSIGEERDEESTLPIDEGGWLTVFFLIRVFSPGSTTRSSSWSGNSRARGQQSSRRRLTRLWGESHDNTENNSPAPRDDDNESSDGGSGAPWRRRVRRRTTPNEEQ